MDIGAVLAHRPEEAVLLCALSAWVFLAASCFALSFCGRGAESQAEKLLATSIVGIGMIETVIFGLGWAGFLERNWIALCGFVLGLFAIVSAFSNLNRARGTALWSAFTAMVRAPFALASALLKLRSPALLTYLWTIGLGLWTAWLAYLAPSGSWDGIWYHEPMVGFALQYRGFQRVPLPSNLEMINGYPRGAENLMIWAVALLDRRLIDAVPSLAFAMAGLAVYVLARRHGASLAGSVGASAVALTIPGAALQLRSTYVDLVVLAAILASLAFATRPHLRAIDVWLSMISLAWLASVKANGLFFAALIGTGLFFRIMRMAFRKPSFAWPLFGAFVFGLLFFALFALPTYLRNLLLHSNPFWPLRFEFFGFKFEGPIDAGHMQRGWDYIKNELFGPPHFGEDYHDTGQHAYGYGLPFVALPIFVIAFFALLERLFVREEGNPIRHPHGLFFSLLIGALVQATSPGHHWARFSLAFPAIVLVIVASWLGRPGRQRFEEAAFSSMALLNALLLLWARPGWDVTIKQGIELALMPPSQRRLAETSLCLLPPQTRQALEEEIGPGDVVAFSEDIGFIGNLWNEQFSNRVLFVPFRSSSNFLSELDRVNAKWVCVRSGSIHAAALLASSQWVRLGPAAFADEIYARRKKNSP
ncbi:MAG: hypothetical protein RMJ84_06220 [Sandaracinaceae bacterium]|nr:hypothetical protein [Sandaracinaceae bacterium]